MREYKLVVILLIFMTLTMILTLIIPRLGGDSEIVIDVTTEQFEFTPNIINVTYQSTVTLRITSLDVTHGFQLEEFGLYNVQTPVGQVTEVTFIANQRGSFNFYCTVICGTRHTDHLGTLVVT